MYYVKVEDGIINKEMWLQSEFKVLFILKESYGGLRVEGVDTNSIIKHINYYGAWGHTYVPCARLISSLNNNNFNRDALKSAAIINIIKDSGDNHHTSWNKLRKGFEVNKELLLEQINNINPNIIVFGNTYYLFEEYWDEIPSLDYNEIKLVKNTDSVFDGRIICSCYHPVAWKKEDIFQIAMLIKKEMKLL